MSLDMPMLRKSTLFIGLSAVVVILDLISKWLITSRLALHQSVEVIPDFFNIIHIRNTGAAFGILSNTALPYRTFFFVIITVIAMALILLFLRNLKSEQTGWVVGLGLVFGGAWGNLIDRIRLGAVIDFIDIYVNRFHWPAFNVADSAVSIGALYLLLQIIRKN